MSRQQSALITCFILFFLSACSSVPKTPDISWETQQQKLKALTEFEARGVVGFISLNQRISAKFIWEQNGENVKLRLYKDLAGTLMTLKSANDVTEVTDKDGNIYQGTDAESLMKELTGIDLPVSNLPGWLKGLPGKMEDYELDDKARVGSITSSDSSANWSLSYLMYTMENTVALPARINMNNGKQRVKIQIKDWVL
ncbi:lipoprotein insertase outer membrane protein LolB [Veronia nyctiphanis]|nr:lipoprotein insertase outer membrane protein LolB [Veronia nyctiphanis]